MDVYNRGGRSKYSMKVHLIFVTKYRKKIFKSDKRVKDVKQFLYDATRKYGYEIIQMEDVLSFLNDSEDEDDKDE